MSLVNILKKAGKGVAIGAGSVAGLYAVVLGGSIGLAKISGSQIVTPSTPLSVEVRDNAIRVESRGYIGPHLTKNLLTDETKIEWFQPDYHLDFFNDFPTYIDRDGDGLVDNIIRIIPRGPFSSLKEYERITDLAQNRGIFARADREFREVLDRYKPYIHEAELSLF